MSFKDCIATGVASGKISEAKGDAAAAAYDEAVADGMANGLGEDAAHNAASAKAVDEIAKLNAAKKWERINDLRKANSIYETFSKSEDLKGDLKRFSDRQEIIQRRVVSQSMPYLSQMIEKYSPKMAGIVHPIEDLDKIVDAAYADSAHLASPEAAAMFKGLSDLMEFMRERANMEGTSIPDNPNHRLPQQLDKFLVRHAGETIEQSRAQFVQDMLNHLDWAAMEFGGKSIAPQDRVAVLERSFDGIVTDSADRIVPAHGKGENLASRIARERFFYYKDANSYRTMMSKYGSGNLYDQIISAVHRRATDIAQLETLGPNPVTMNSYLHGTVLKRASELDLRDGRPSRPEYESTSKAKTSLDIYDNRYKLLVGDVLNGRENRLATALGTAETLLGTALTSHSFTNLGGDLGMLKAAKDMYGLPVGNVVSSWAQTMADNSVFGSSSARAWMRDSQIILDSEISQNYSYQRNFGVMEGSRWAKRFSDVIYRAQLAALHHTSIRSAWSKEMMNGWAHQASSSWDKLNPKYTDLMSYFGLTEKDWDHFRATELNDVNGTKFLRPVDLWNKGGALDKRVSDKFTDFLDYTSRLAAHTPSTSANVFLGKHLPATEFPGQMARITGMIKTFTVTMFLTRWQNAMEYGTAMDKSARIAKLALWMTIGGAAMTQMKALVAGDNLHDMSTLDFWGRAVINGGTFGLLGDYIMNTINQVDEGNATPFGEFGHDLNAVTLGALAKKAQGKDVHEAKNAAMFMSRYTPKPWQISLAFDRLVRDEIIRSADPSGYAALQSAQQKRAQKLNTGTWWGIGRAPQAPGYGR